MGQEIIDNENEPDEISQQDEEQKKEEFYRERSKSRMANLIKVSAKNKIAPVAVKSFFKKKIIIWILSVILPVIAIIIGIIGVIIFIMMVLNYSQSVSL